MMRRLVFSIFFSLLAGIPLAGQTGVSQEILQKADSLHRAYHFKEAIDLYGQAAEAGDDAACKAEAHRRMAFSQNALHMADRCAQPHVVARQCFSREDFFLFYPLPAKSWHAGPSALDAEGEYPVYVPPLSDVIYFSARDLAGTRSLFITEDLDSLWRAPRLAGEGPLSVGSEVFPMLSPDGQTLYFASDGLPGMGGFDLFSCTWDSEQAAWSAPENLGFPFNSPADDFLMMDTEDGKYTLFASNRDCPPDSVCIYVLEFEALRPRLALSRPDDLALLAQLRPVEDPTRIDNASAFSSSYNVPSNANTRLYMSKMAEARALRDSIYKQDKALDELRLRLSMAADAETAALSARIQEKEALLAPLRQLLEQTNRQIRQVEQSFLQSGVVSGASRREDREVVGAATGYTFAKNSMGGPLQIEVQQVQEEPLIKVMPVGRFSLDNTLPEGLVYQIELFSSPRHATLEDIQGLSPVYERLDHSLQYTYSVGLFDTYRKALRELNSMRVLGFPQARIVAFRDGQPIPVSQARQEE